MESLLLFGTMVLLLAFGVPIAFALGMSSVAYLLATGAKPLILIAQRTVLGTDSFPLLAIPLFTLGGYLMESSGMSARLVGFIEKLMGNSPSSVGNVTIVCCTLFAALTGSGPATVAAIGAIMLPAMLSSGYSRGAAGGILASAGALGPVIPPSIGMIVYGSTMNLSIPDMFVAAIIPGIIIALMYVLTNNFVYGRKSSKLYIGNNSMNQSTYTPKECLTAFWKAVPVLLMPVLILGGIYSGIVTPTEAAVVCVVYSLVLGLIYKELSFEKLIKTMKRTIITSGMVMFIVAMSANFGWILAAEKIPTMIANAIVPYLGNQYIYMLLLMLFLFVAGCFMEVLALIVILAPILVPIGIEMGIDPLHLGVIFCIALVLGLITPPFGINLFTSVAVCETSFIDVVKGVLPFMIVALATVLALAFIPASTLWLPGLLKG